MGGESEQVVNQRTDRIVGFSCILIPISYILYGMFVYAGVDLPHQQIDAWVYSAVSIAWLSVVIYRYTLKQHSLLQSAVLLGAYHLCMAIFIVCISGFSMPLVVAWAILFIASYKEFSHHGLGLSITALVVTATVDSWRNIGDEQYILTNILAFIATVTVGLVAVMITQTEEAGRAELATAKTESILQRDRAMTLINNVADAIVATDSAGTIRMYNAASLGLLDTNTALDGAGVDAVFKLFDDDNKPFKLSRALKQSKSVVSREDLRATISDEIIRMSVVYSPIRSIDSATGHDADGYIIIMRDITKQKSLEEERDEFISVVSHELRTPITVAEGTLSNVSLMMNRDDIPKATLSQNVSVVHEQVLFLAKMVNDLSTLSRAERGVADAPEHIDVKALIEELYTEYAHQAESKGLKFNLDLDTNLGYVDASRLYLKELLQNFITNAIKYTKEGSIAVVVRRSSKQITFSVVDTGIGISKSDQKRIFEKFFRSEDYRTRETGGTGLGLYVAQKLSKKLDTHIEMKSRLNHGSTFQFDLPSS